MKSGRRNIRTKDLWGRRSSEADREAAIDQRSGGTTSLFDNCFCEGTKLRGKKDMNWMRGSEDDMY